MWAESRKLILDYVVSPKDGPVVDTSKAIRSIKTMLYVPSFKLDCNCMDKISNIYEKLNNLNKLVANKLGIQVVTLPTYDHLDIDPYFMVQQYKISKSLDFSR